MNLFKSRLAVNYLSQPVTTLYQALIGKRSLFANQHSHFTTLNIYWLSFGQTQLAKVSAAPTAQLSLTIK
ncbi:hypothetical protein PTUN_b0133 [Pseudoalteromonas tunicata]|jgi:hypothetical protein|nr:hypothetical protein PTUN_b0133 [Pseudoalteromonas tunicata]AXT32770.1 hypothetical protein D1819_18120 [Pseudoalteromonas tunicata]